MKHMYKQPKIKVAAIAPQQIVCTSGDTGSGWVEMGGYNANTGTGFQQEP